VGGLNHSQTANHRGGLLGKIDASLNQKLQKVKWGEFTIGSLFEVVGTKSLDSNAITFTKKGINFVGRTFENNGIQGKIEKQDFEPNKPFSITATVIGNYKYVKYQKEHYYCSQNINKLTPKFEMSENVAYFMITNIYKFVSQYNGQQGGYKLEDMKKFKIHLPVDQNNQINFAFMESFVAELEVQRVAELEAYLNATGLTDYTLTEDEQKALERFEKGEVEFEEVNIIDYFTIKNSGNILAKDIVENSGNIPYLSASKENNAVSSYILYNEKFIDKGNCVFIGGKTFVVSYQEKDFFSNDSHNLSLYLIEREKQNRFTNLCFATCINKSLSPLYSWDNSISKAKIKKDKISLPTTATHPDYAFMQTLISAVQKLVIADVVRYADRKIATTKSLLDV
jgi:hypothetical protein